MPYYPPTTNPALIDPGPLSVGSGSGRAVVAQDGGASFGVEGAVIAAFQQATDGTTFIDGEDDLIVTLAGSPAVHFSEYSTDPAAPANGKWQIYILNTAGVRVVKVRYKIPAGAVIAWTSTALA